jgi:glycosyltransferase involved in cell wall biosynthesis
MPDRATVIHVNGKWLARPLTGTGRYAQEIIRALVESRAHLLVVHVPSDAVPPDWLVSGARIVRHRTRGLLFEQVGLPSATAGRLLLNLAGPAPLLKRRQVLVMHDAGVLRSPQSYGRLFVLWYRLLYTLQSRLARGVATVSQFSRSELAAALRRPQDRFVVIPCGHEHFTGLATRRPDLPAGFDPARPFLVCVGTLAPHKNLVGPVRAMVSAGWQVLVVGASGPAQVFASSAELPAGAVVLGRISDEELGWCYDHAFALVFPSRYEGFGLPVVEAQTRGCPVVASDRASLPEVVGEGGLHFAPDDHEGLLRRLADLRDANVRHALVAAGRRNVERFRWGESAAVLASFSGDAGRPVRRGPGWTSAAARCAWWRRRSTDGPARPGSE